ncbi:MHYT domain-containing protein [Aurantimonas marianensis]|uniref:LytTR family transcriptional regulator DNA-binding domain-containing protein n=1 Tax=Aurantimonas marianensis TaxID=2920428 RepID=A0A9X2H7R6_9HYPH|nr:MHYT domain-containing protein [Aurantimonas marianensis]MCP3055836.1 LytTR family transcriptional regulator DNA-binding domain-containing protein [Aurantimonas marianensis]
MFDGHNFYLVALSVTVAILGGYTGFGLAARVRGAPGLTRRLLLAGAAVFLAVSIWTMHFIGMLAAPLPQSAGYLVLPTIVSFLICALVVGVSLFFVSVGEPSEGRVIASALLLGVGIVSMHYVGIHGLAGDFAIEHDPVMVGLAALIAFGTAYGGLRILIAAHDGRRLAPSAVAFGLAVSGMHYTAMYGMRLQRLDSLGGASPIGLVASAEVLALIVALLCFVVAAGFLLLLVPEPRQRTVHAFAPAGFGEAASATGALGAGAIHAPTDEGPLSSPPVTRLPVEGPDGTHFINVAEVRGVKADAHYTLVHDGTRERMCPWSISTAEARLDPAQFVRVHRSHIVAIPHVASVRRAGDGGIVELDGPAPHQVPVSRARIAELKTRLGLARHGARPQKAKNTS